MHIALVPAAGIGQRFNINTVNQRPKQYTHLNKKTMLEHTVQALLNFSDFVQILVVVSPDDTDAAHYLSAFLNQYSDRLVLSFVGGETRAATVNNGLKLLIKQGFDDNTWIWVHDAARPAIALAQLNALKQALLNNKIGAILATPVVDTLKRATTQLTQNHINNINNINHSIIETVLRQNLWQAQTPQCFGLKALSSALTAAQAAHYTVTDEASAIERLGHQPTLVVGHIHNFKVTHFEDAALMAAILRMNTPTTHSKIAIGEGMDVHALVVGRPLILGGVTVPHPKGLQGHSDADALLHAITDALLGAAGMGDIGRLFPDTDTQYAGADSQLLLSRAYQMVSKVGWRVNNVDATIVAQAPKMAAYIPAMQNNIARCLNITSSQVNVKAKTNEKLGWLGREEGIETRAVVLLCVAN
ncbi:MAG: 2C-methyl-D-erythritol 2,4-cyclodiphosphate synthase [Pseudomonadota bacterium]|jgi:2-C-methyl-D-erythritol 4-phosphate cytidylyltransferase/2-C-methyl-D-erythritol 2,4-cyclodiphosphate synthase